MFRSSYDAFAGDAGKDGPLSANAASFTPGIALGRTALGVRVQPKPIQPPTGVHVRNCSEVSLHSLSSLIATSSPILDVVGPSDKSPQQSEDSKSNTTSVSPIF